jgi:hypothetical protein
MENRIGALMVSVIASSAVDRGFGPQLGQTKDYKICDCYFSCKPAALKNKSKDWFCTRLVPLVDVPFVLD